MITVDQTGRRTLITGAGGGLGSHFSEAFAQAGAHVVLNDRNASDNSSGVNDLATQLQNRRLVAFANLYAIDLPGAAQKIMDDTIDLIRGLDTLILNAGVTGVAARVEDMQEEDLADVMAINFTANVSLVQAALPHLRQSDAGRILFISSTASLYGMRGRAHYAASKAAINALALTLASEQRRNGLGVNILMPYAASAMTAGIDPGVLEKINPCKVSPAALWLTSAQCTHSGEVWVAGAGVYRRATTLESRGLFIAEATPSQLGIAHDPIAEIARARSFNDGESAFQDLLSFGDSEGQGN